MILHLDSDAAYLVSPQARSRVVSNFYCRQKYNKNKPPYTNLNGPIHIECKT